MTADVRALVAHSDRLAKAIGDLNAAPTSDNVTETRQRWHDAVVVWTRASCFRNGPLVETSTLLRALHWPVQKNGVEGLVLGGRPIDDALIEKAPVDQKGLYAIELLVFPSVSADRARVELLAPEGARARLLAAALAVNVSRCAGAVHQALGDGKSYAESFARNGQESVSLLVNQMVENVENASGRLLRLSPFQNAKERGRIEEGPRETSRDLVIALIEGTERLYVGDESEGLGALVKGTAPAIDKGIRTAFAEARRVVQQLDVGTTSPSEPLRAAFGASARALKSLEVAMKADLANALSVTLTFPAPTPINRLIRAEGQWTRCVRA